jgi:phage replication initiation protein
MFEHHFSPDGTLRTACPPAAKRGRTAGAQSPHVVKRGETLPRIDSVSDSPLEAPQAAHIDWLALTLTPPPEAQANPIAWLFPQMVALFGLVTLTLESIGKGWNGYTHRFNIGENAQYGLIAYGGDKQRGTVHLELNATACALVPDWRTVQQWGESLGAKITRVDLAHDDMQAQVISIAVARAWYEAGEFTSNGRPPAAKLIDDMGSGKGKTLYIGARANGKLLRVYEKGRQLGDPSSPWVRVELELRNKSRVIPWDVLTTPASYLAGGYPCLAFLSAVQDKIRTLTKAVQITIGSIVHYLRTAGGKSINVLMQVHSGDAFALVNAIKRDGIPRRLVNYADFLPCILDGSEVLT